MTSHENYAVFYQDCACTGRVCLCDSEAQAEESLFWWAGLLQPPRSCSTSERKFLPKTWCLP